MKKFNYIYNKQGNKIKITDKNFMVFDALPKLKTKLLFKNVKLCEENISNYADHNAAIYFLYLYIVQNMIIFIWEEEGVNSDEIPIKYKNIFMDILPRLLYVSKSPKYKEKHKIPTTNIDKFKALPDKIHFLFFLSVFEITTTCLSYLEDSSILLNQYKKLFKKSCHEYGGAANILLGIFDKYSCREETQNENPIFREFWGI